MPIARPLSSNLLTGLGLLAMAGATFPLTRRIPLMPVVAALPGAWFIGRAGPAELGWVFPLAVVVTVLSGPVVAAFDENAKQSPVPTLLFALTAAGVWATVPDTEEALVILGVLTATTLLAWPMGLARLGMVWHLSVGRPSFLGDRLGWQRTAGIDRRCSCRARMLVTAPVAAWMAGRSKVTTAGWLGPSLIVLHALLVAMVTRIAGLKTGGIDAAVIAIPSVTAAMLLWLVVEQRSDGASP